MSIAVRPARPEDRAAVRRILESAFPSAAEADLVEQLERDGDLAIALVAEDGGALAGYAAFSRMSVSVDGEDLRALGLGPVAIAPDRQQAGIGSALVEAGLGAAAAAGEQLVFVLGEPGFYGRFGFDAEAALPYASPYAGPYFMMKPLTIPAPVQAPVAARADYAPAFAALGEGPVRG